MNSNSNRARNSNKKGRSSRSRTNMQSQILSALKEIADSESTQVRGLVPKVPDILPLRLPINQVYTFNKKSIGPTLAAGTIVDLTGAIQFDLNLTTDVANFQALFDAWRIREVEVVFTPLTTGPYQSPLYTVIDYDDANTPPTIAGLLEYDTCEMTQAGSMVIRHLRPRAALASFNSALFSNYAEAPADMWNDVASPSTKYYGLKYGIPALTGGTTTISYSVVLSVIYQFKNTR